MSGPRHSAARVPARRQKAGPWRSLPAACAAGSTRRFGPGKGTYGAHPGLLDAADVVEIRQLARRPVASVLCDVFRQLIDDALPALTAKLFPPAILIGQGGVLLPGEEFKGHA